MVSLAATSSAFAAPARRMFHSNGRAACADSSIMSSTTGSGNVEPLVCGARPSTVPGNSPQTAANVSSSSVVACLEGTGFPSASECASARLDENPSPPAASPSRSSALMAAISSGVAARSVAAAPSTQRRSVEWPTKKPMLGATRPSTRAK